VRVALVSANLGQYDPPVDWPDQIVPADVTVDVHRFTDANFPPRPKAMTSRLQCGIPKWCGPDLVRGADVYLWLDASVAPTPIAVCWFLAHLDCADIAVFQHPARRTIRAEYLFMVSRMARRGEQYLNGRYQGEWLREQHEHIAADPTYWDTRLYASTAFAYRPTAKIRAAFWDIWAAKARWCLHDQLWFPYALTKHACDVNVIPDNYLYCPALCYVRNETRKGRA